MRFIGRLNACLPYKHARGCTSVLKEMVTYLCKEGRSGVYLKHPVFLIHDLIDFNGVALCAMDAIFATFAAK